MVCLFFLLLVVLFPGAHAEACVESVRGTASVMRNGRIEPLRTGSRVEPGELIATGVDGSAVLRMARGDRFEVFPGSLATLRRNSHALRDQVARLLSLTTARIERVHGTPRVIAVRG